MTIRDRIPCSFAAKFRVRVLVSEATDTYDIEPNPRSRDRCCGITKWWSFRFLNRRFVMVSRCMGQKSCMSPWIERVIENRKTVWNGDFDRLAYEQRRRSWFWYFSQTCISWENDFSILCSWERRRRSILCSRCCFLMHFF